MRRILPAAAIVTLLGAGLARAGDKPTAESIVARHLAALGGSDATAAQALRVIEGRWSRAPCPPPGLSTTWPAAARS